MGKIIYCDIRARTGSWQDLGVTFFSIAMVDNCDLHTVWALLCLKGGVLNLSQGAVYTRSLI